MQFSQKINSLKESETKNGFSDSFSLKKKKKKKKKYFLH